MERLIRLLQIQTKRSAWVFLFGSAAMLLFGVYISLGGFNRQGQSRAFALPILVPWFVVTGSYIAIAIWTLFSVRGQRYLAAEEQRFGRPGRGWLWYAKFLFACYAAAFATMLLLGLLALPLAGYSVLEAMFRPYYLLFFGFLWAPFIFKYLK